MRVVHFFCSFTSLSFYSRSVTSEVMSRRSLTVARRIAHSLTSRALPPPPPPPPAAAAAALSSTAAFVSTPTNKSLSRPVHRNIATSVSIRASVANESTGFRSPINTSIVTHGLNPSQEEATLRPRYSITRVIAGPGAGKTKVLTCRIAHLLLNSESDIDASNGHLRPEGILAVTFTKKAAMEMEKRLSDLISSSTKLMFENDQNKDGAIPRIDGEYDAIVINGNVDSPEEGEANEIARQLMRQTTVGTFHSTCSKILRKFGDELRMLPSVRECIDSMPIPNAEGQLGEPTALVQLIDGSFNILDQSDQLRILKDILKEHNIELKSNDGMSRGGRGDDVRPITILNAISLLNTEAAILITPQKNARKDTISEETADKMSRKVRKIAEEIRIPFQKAKYAQNSIDFDDLIFLTRELLLFRPDVREVLHRRWRHILVDEFQDTSQIQLDMVRLLTTNSLFVVGDGDQSIYSWRGASPESMSDFESAFHDKMHGWEGLVDHSSIDLTQYYKDLDRMRNVDGHGSSPLQVQSVYLMENYRSTTNIVKAAQRIISSSEGDKIDAQDGIRRDMKPMRGVGPSPRVLACKDAKSESNFVVKSVNEMIEKGDLSPSSTVAIIYRTNAQSRLIEEACVEHNLRYVVRGSTGTFYKRAEIQDSLSFLKIMYNSRDRSAWARAVKAPSRGIGETSFNEFFRYCDAVTEKYAQTSSSGGGSPTPMDVLLSLVNPHATNIHELVPPTEFLSTRSINRFSPFASNLALLREKLKTRTVNEFLLSVIEDLNLNSHFDAISKTRDEYEDRLSNVMELVRAAERYKDDGPCIGSGTDDESPLERFLDDVALIADIEPDTNDEDSGDKRIVANLMTIHSSKGMEFDAVFLVGNEEGTFPTQKAIGQGEGSIELSEERRLCYVAMTRAKTHLVMTWRQEVSYFAGSSFNTRDADRSRFLNILVSKPKPGAVRNKTTKAVQAANIKSSKSGRRMIHTEAARRKDVQISHSSPPPRSDQSWDDREPSQMQWLTAGRNVVRTENHPKSPASLVESKSWDNWEPSQARKPIQHVPSIKVKSTGTNQQQKTATRLFGSVSSVEKHSEVSRTPQKPMHKQPSSIQEKQRQLPNRQPISNIADAQRKQPIIKNNDAIPELEKGDPPPEVDSTIFYPIGSSVKHQFYGRGTVQPPPKSDPEFVEKLLVRVKFADEGDNYWDMPMDSLTHTYES